MEGGWFFVVIVVILVILVVVGAFLGSIVFGVQDLGLLVDMQMRLVRWGSPFK